MILSQILWFSRILPLVFIDRVVGQASYVTVGKILTDFSFEGSKQSSTRSDVSFELPDFLRKALDLSLENDIKGKKTSTVRENNRSLFGDICEDDESFRDRFGLACENHLNSSCALMGFVGFTDKQVEELLFKCPRSCKHCGDSPTATPTNVPTSTPTRNCRDDITYRDRFGLPCSRHSRTNCALMEYIGFSKLQVADLIDNCPDSCGYCIVTTFPSLAPSNLPSKVPTNAPSNDPSASPTAAPTYTPSSIPSGVPTLILTVIPSTVPSMVPSSQPTKSCHDVESFRDKFGLNCKYHVDSQCTHMQYIGFSKAQVKDLVKNCPESCGYCSTGVPTGLPSFTPSNFPSSLPSSSPSVEPSSVPSEVPSSAPSRIPTFIPSSSPSSQPLTNPSSIPTNGPSKKPTPHPTGDPTKKPTKSPTGRPTRKPSPHPTPSPSAIPSVSPTDAPKTAPSDTPSTVPSAIPSDVPSGLPSTVPSFEPTKLPSWAPTNYPTLTPTFKPTENMVDRPSTSPSFSGGPTVSPTLYPTKFPTILPSNYPSSIPSYTPLEISTISATPFEVNLSPMTGILSTDALRIFNDACDNLLEQSISQTSLDSSSSITFSTIVLDQVVYARDSSGRKLAVSSDGPRLGLRLKKIISIESKPLESESVYMPSVAMLDGFVKKTFDSDEHMRKIISDIQMVEADIFGVVNKVEFAGFLQIEGMPTSPERLSSVLFGGLSGFNGQDVDSRALIISCVAGACVLLMVAVILIVRARTAGDDQSFHEYLQYNSQSGSDEDMDLKSPQSSASQNTPTTRGTTRTPGSRSNRSNRTPTSSKRGTPTRRYATSSPQSSKSPRRGGTKSHASSDTSPRKNKGRGSPRNILRMPSPFGKSPSNTPRGAISISYSESGDGGMNVELMNTMEDDLPEVLLEEAVMRGNAVGKTSRPEAFHEIPIHRDQSGNSKRLQVNDSLISEVTLGSLEPVNKSMLSGDMKKTWDDWKQYIARPMTPTKNMTNEKAHSHSRATKSASSKIPRSRSVGARDVRDYERDGTRSAASPYRTGSRRSFAVRGAGEARDLYMQQSASADYGERDRYADSYRDHSYQRRGTYSYDDIDEMQLRSNDKKQRRNRNHRSSSVGQRDFAELPSKFLDSGANLVVNMFGPRREKFLDGNIR